VSEYDEWAQTVKGGVAIAQDMQRDVNKIEAEIAMPKPKEHARRTDPDTSHQAAKLLGGKAGTMLRQLLEVFARRAMTADEAAIEAGFSPADGAWKRVSDLAKAKLIMDSGVTRPGRSGRQQRVMQITPLGREVLGR
jgi:hypothetical protein